MKPVLIKGAPAEIGEALGRLGRPAARHIKKSADWAALRAWRGKPQLADLAARTREAFPSYWEELQAMSEGIGIGIDDLFLWNCRVDLLDATCSQSNSIAVNRLGGALVLHKLQLAPPLGKYCAIVDVQPEVGPGFLALAVPGCLPGTGFAANRAGVAQVVDHMAPAEAGGGLPGFIIGRAVLDAASLSEAIAMVMELPRLGAAHHILAASGEFIMVGIEASPSGRKLVPIPNKYWHANLPAAAAPASTASASCARQAALARLVERMPSHPGEEDLVSLLQPHGVAAGAIDAGPDAAVILPEEDGIGTALIKLMPARVDLRLFRASQAQPCRHAFPVIPGKTLEDPAEQSSCC